MALWCGEFEVAPGDRNDQPADELGDLHLRQISLPPNVTANRGLSIIVVHENVDEGIDGQADPLNGGVIDESKEAGKESGSMVVDVQEEEILFLGDLKGSVEKFVVLGDEEHPVPETDCTVRALLPEGITKEGFERTRVLGGEGQFPKLVHAADPHDDRNNAKDPVVSPHEKTDIDGFTIFHESLHDCDTKQIENHCNRGCRPVHKWGHSHHRREFLDSRLVELHFGADKIQKTRLMKKTFLTLFLLLVLLLFRT